MIGQFSKSVLVNSVLGGAANAGQSVAFNCIDGKASDFKEIAGKFLEGSGTQLVGSSFEAVITASQFMKVVENSGSVFGGKKLYATSNDKVYITGAVVNNTWQFTATIFTAKPNTEIDAIAGAGK